MIGICSKCGDYRWNKSISEDGNRVVCPSCGFEWKFTSLPLFVLTGCSGVGKTTTAQALLQRETTYLLMDADFFGFMGEDYQARAEQVLNLSKNLMQSGKPVLWTMAGALEKLDRTYHRRFFRSIYYLALVCDVDDLRHRMRVGRAIQDEEWIQRSVEHNAYLMRHDSIEGVGYDRFDITGKSVDEVADYVDSWIREKWNAERES